MNTGIASTCFEGIDVVMTLPLTDKFSAMILGLVAHANCFTGQDVIDVLGL